MSCTSFDTELHCSRYAVTIVGQGPFDAALDLVGGDGSGGFYELTLWNPKDTDGVFAIADTLKAKGWLECFTGGPTGGDQAPTRGRDLLFLQRWTSGYRGTRRLRVIPGLNKSKGRC